MYWTDWTILPFNAIGTLVLIDAVFTHSVEPIFANALKAAIVVLAVSISEADILRYQALVDVCASASRVTGLAETLVAPNYVVTDAVVTTRIVIAFIYVHTLQGWKKINDFTN